MKFQMRMADDFHLHLRNGEMLRAVLPQTARQFKRAVIMPNTTPRPILNALDLRTYRTEIMKLGRSFGFEPLMTIQIIESTSRQTIAEAKKAGAVAGKIYPRGMTTNSENGVADYQAIYPTLEAMEECGMLALFHGESPELDLFCLDREKRFLKILKGIAKTFPGLKIVMEHCTTAEAIECVGELPKNVAATITIHHLFLTLNDVIGDKLEPHHFCKPVAKRPEDRHMLLVAATGGNPKFFLGTDSAPHPKELKECSSGCAGVYTAPAALPLLLEVFEQQNSTDKVEDFCSSFGADFYGLPRNKEVLSFLKEKWTIPSIYDGVVPFRAGREVSWRIG